MNKTIFGVLTLLLLASCFKKNKFPSTPKISFGSFEMTGDSAKLVFSFEDGEGDIGLDPSQVSSPYDIGSFYYYNLYLVYYEKKDIGGWQPGTDLNGDSIVFANRLKPIYTGKEKSISGTVEYTIEPIFYNLVSTDSDTIKYRILLIDRALNKSNWIETNEIYP
ncbi:MAG: hypothetical protein ACSHXL_03025 [Bacteroidota bacterium]